MPESRTDRGSDSSAAFGRELRRRREAAGLSQEQLADRARLSVEAISALERGKRRSPQPRTLDLIADALGLAPDDRAGLRAAVHSNRQSGPASALSLSESGRIRLSRSIAPLVGRASELAALRSQFDRARAGHGGLVLVAGEAGVGKTTLVSRIAQEAAGEGALVLIGRGYDLTETPPYGPWGELLRSISDSHRPVPSTPFDGSTAGISSQDDLFGRVRETLRALASEHCLVLVLDDLQWADEASVELLRVVARDLTALPILILVAYRSEEVTREHPLYARLPLVMREAQPLRLELTRLDAQGVRQVVRERYPLADSADEERLVAHLQEWTGGNPFYLGEMLHAFAEGGLLRAEGDRWWVGDLAHARLPPLLRQVTDTRVARLGEGARGLLEVAAVIGKEVPLTVWGAVAGVPEGALLDLVERAVAASILTEDPDGTRVQFAHDLLREALYEGMLVARRRVWHRQVGEALASDLTADPNAVAYHFREAGDLREIDWLIRAGDRARSLFLSHLAIDLYTRALDLSRRGGTAVSSAAAPTPRASYPDTRNVTPDTHSSSPVPAYRGRGLAYQQLGNFGAARDDLETVLALARARGDEFEEWQALLDLGFLWEGQDYTRAGAYYQQALDLARVAGSPGDLASNLNRLGVWYVNIDRPTEALRYIGEAMALYRQLGDLGKIAQTLELLAMASFVATDIVQCLRYARESLALARERGDHQTLMSALVLLSGGSGMVISNPLVFPLPFAEAQAYGEEAVRVAQQIGSPSSESYALRFLAVCLGGQGHYTRALDLAQRSLEVAEGIHHRELVAAALENLAILYFDLICLDLAQLRFERALAHAREIGSPYFVREIASLLALVLVQQGEVARAESLLVEVLRPDDPLDTQALRMCWHTRAILALARDDPATALEIIDRLISTDPNWSDDLLSPQLVELRARALMHVGRLAEAETDLLAARRFAERQGARTLLWQLDALLAALYHLQGRASDAEAATDVARRLVYDIAAEIPRELRDVFLRGAALRLGTAAARAPRQVRRAAVLSPREAEVLRLLAEGLSNAEIAERLVVSPRTVNTHLTSIYTKLNVSSRGAAIRFALEHGRGSET